MILRFLTLFSCLLGLASAFGETQYEWSQPGKLLLHEDFDSAELPKLFLPLLADGAEAIGIVAGQRVGRQDTLSKKLASRFANGLRSWMLRDGTRDTGCGLKAFRRDAFLRLPFFNHMHRYLPALFARDGWQVAHVDVSHRPRGAGRSNYNNLQRGLVGAVDLFGVMWLLRRRKTSAPVELRKGG